VKRRLATGHSVHNATTTTSIISPEAVVRERGEKRVWGMGNGEWGEGKGQRAKGKGESVKGKGCCPTSSSHLPLPACSPLLSPFTFQFLLSPFSFPFPYPFPGQQVRIGSLERKKKLPNRPRARENFTAVINRPSEIRKA
jgi:hypothetical protein